MRIFAKDKYSEAIQKYGEEALVELAEEINKRKDKAKNAKDVKEIIEEVFGRSDPEDTQKYLSISYGESLIIQGRAEVRKIYGRILSKLRRNTDVFQGDLARLCREDFVLMRGGEFLEVPISYYLVASRLCAFPHTHSHHLLGGDIIPQKAACEQLSFR